MKVEDAIAQVAKDKNLPVDFVSKVYKSYWRAVREYIKSLPLKDRLSEEEFKKVRPNINIPSIGKFYITFERYRKLWKSKDIVDGKIDKPNKN